MDVRWAPHEQVVSAIRRHVTALDLVVQSCRPQLLPILERKRADAAQVNGSRSEVKAIPVTVSPTRQQPPQLQPQPKASGASVQLAVRDAHLAPVKEPRHSRHQRPESRQTGLPVAGHNHNHHKHGVKETKRGQLRDRDAKHGNDRPTNGLNGNTSKDELGNASLVQTGPVEKK